MTRRPAPIPARLAWLLTCAAAAALLCGVACGSDTASTSECPQVPLYDVRTADVFNDPALRDALLKAADAGCITYPEIPDGGTAPTPDAGAD